MKLIPIKEKLEDNTALFHDSQCTEIVQMTVNYYKAIGFVEPWIGYLAEVDGKLVGSAGFKGQPINGKIEIAYGIFDAYQKQGMGTAICNELVNLVLKTDPSIKITARTLMEENFSTKILRKNDFTLVGTVIDPEDGEVWEWIYVPEI
jgi:RimJ/RimL family protein N-acetyltransferase